MPDTHGASGEALPLLDLQLPDPVSWWPPAPGWWLLVLIPVAALLIFLFARRYRNRRPQRRYRQGALNELDFHFQHFQRDNEAAVFVQALSGLLKRVALQTDDAERVAFLSGAQWGEYLGQNMTAEQQNLIRKNAEPGTPPQPGYRRRRSLSICAALDRQPQGLISTMLSLEFPHILWIAPLPLLVWRLLPKANRAVAGIPVPFFDAWRELQQPARNTPKTRPTRLASLILLWLLTAASRSSTQLARSGHPTDSQRARDAAGRRPFRIDEN